MEVIHLMSKTKTKQKVSAHYTEKRKSSSNPSENNPSKKSKAPALVQKSNDKKADKIVVSSAKKPPKNKVEKTSKKNTRKTAPLKIIPLGGLDEIGKNLTLYEYEEDIIIVDCGMTFPDEEMLGVDIVIPDFTYIANNAHKIRGIILTHGHEDHIGGLPYLLKIMQIPVYGTNLTLGLVKGKLKEHGIAGSAKLNEIKPGDKIDLGVFKVEFIHVNHSIPDSCGLAIKTPVGTVVQTGDFKIDSTPIDGDVIDIARFSELGKKGVVALLMDSTNATRPGFSLSERKVGESLSNIFKNAGKKRIIVATFSSNIHRVQQIIDEAHKTGRKVVIQGRSMLNVVNIASELGYLNVPEGIIVDIDLLKNYTDESIVIITTGSQGEAMSALHRMAFSDHKKITVTPNDLIIISATPIPGNEKTVISVVNELTKLGAEVVYEKMYEVHASGHACQEELKLMLAMTKPKFFMPVHGERVHLQKNAELGISMGIPKENIIISTIGKVIELRPNDVNIKEEVPSGKLLVDGLGVGDVGNIVLRDRKNLAESGMIVVALTIDTVSYEMVSEPEILSRGFVYVKENEELMINARNVAVDAIQTALDRGTVDINALKSVLKDSLSSYIYKKTRRNPMIMPIIMEI